MSFQKGYTLWERFPIEVRVASFFGFLWVAGLLTGFPLMLPDSYSFYFVERHYFRPLMIALLFQFLFILAVEKSKSNSGKHKPFLTLKLLYFMAFSVFVHFHFKAWMPLVNPYLFDGYYNTIDQYFSPILQFFLTIRHSVVSHVPFNLNGYYHHLFVAMFFISFSLHALINKSQEQRQLVLSACLILLIGGVSYWIAPAEGAYVYRIGVNADSSYAQGNMHAMFLTVRNTGLLPLGYFCAMPAAMPSLHIAHALMFTWFAWRLLPWLLLLYIPALSWLIIESVCSAWHYMIDLPAGAIICFICIKLALRWLPEHNVK